MASVNKVTIVGYLGQDPETKYMPSGDAVTNLSVATTETWKDKASGEKKEKTDWHRIVMYGRQAEAAGEYLKKGSLVYVEGSIHTRKWQDKDGQDRYTTEIKSNFLQFLDRKPSSGERPAEPRREESRPAPAAAAKKPVGAGKFDDMEDDIPF